MESLFGLMVPLIRLVSSIVVIVLFFFFIVRPFFNYLIVNREIEHRKKLNPDAQSDNYFPVDSMENLEGTEDRNTVLGEDFVRGRDGKLSDLETLNRLSVSDPDKASDLVKKWVNDK